MSEERYRLVSELASDWAWSLAIATDGTATIEWVSRSVEELLGRSVDADTPLDALVGQVDPEHLPALQHGFARALQGDTMENIHRVYRLDGSERWIRLRARGVREKRQGRVTRLVGASRDITTEVLAERALKDNEMRLRHLVAVSPVVTYTMGCEENPSVATISDNVADVIGYEAQDLLSDPDFWMNAIHPHDRQVAVAATARCRADGHSEAEVRILHPDGTCRWILAKAVLSQDAELPPGTIIGSLRDITEERALKMSLRTRLAHQRAIGDLGRRALTDPDIDALLHDACAHVARILDAPLVTVLARDPIDRSLTMKAGYGWPVGFVGNARIDVGPGPLDRATTTAAGPVVFTGLKKCAALPSVLADQGIDTGIAAIIGSGKEPWGSLCAHDTRSRGFSQDDAVFIQTVANLLAESIRRHEAVETLTTTLRELRNINKDRRRLIEHLMSAHEDERQTIADDIHDDTIQIMAAVGMELHVLRQNLKDERASELADHAEGTVSLATLRLRQLLFDLHPPTLDTDGLGAAIEQYMFEHADVGHLDWIIEDKVGPLLPPRIRTVAYRIAQEALTNMRKHSHATHVFIEVESIGDDVALTITDDGVGFDTARPVAGHLGLRSMTERAELAGGRFAISSAPGAGTTVTAVLPLSGH